MRGSPHEAKGESTMNVRDKAIQTGAAAVAAAALWAGAAGFAQSIHAQAPAAPAPAAPSGVAPPQLNVPVVRFYGKVINPAGQAVVDMTMGASVGGISCTSSSTPTNLGTAQTLASGNNVSTDYTDNAGNYLLDIQDLPGCSTPGAKVNFSAGGLKAKETGTVPDLQGSAVHLDLTLQAPPTRTPTPAPRPAVAPPPPPVVRTPPPPAATPARVQGPRGIQGPAKAQGPVKGPVRAQGPAKAAGKPSYQAPAYGAGGGAPAAAAPRLPSTGTGGLLDQSAAGGNGWALAAVLLAALGMAASGLVRLGRTERGR